MKNRLIIFIVIIFVVLGCFTCGYLLFSNKDDKQTVATTETTTPIATAETVTTRDILKEKEPIIISDDELIAQIKNKRYLESSYMALEYSKISNAKLIEVLKNYIEDSNGMQPQDIKEIVELHEKTFLNRYLKVYILTVDKTIDTNMKDVDTKMKNALYQMKSAYATFAAYGRDKITTDENGKTTNHGPSWDINILKLGVQALETANNFVNDTLEVVGVADIKIEKAWIDANLNANDLTTVLNKTNVVETVDDLNDTPKKSYTDPSGTTEIEEIVVDDISSPIDTEQPVVEDLELSNSNTSTVEEDIPYVDDMSLDLSDLQ